MGIAIFVGLALVALVIVGFMVHGMFLGIARLARLSNQAVRWLITPQPVGELAMESLRASRCWDLKQCSGETRESCPAYLNNDVPCWMATMQADTQHRVKADCLGCSLFSLPQVVGQV
jgi:hypothetical protein